MNFSRMFVMVALFATGQVLAQEETPTSATTTNEAAGLLADSSYLSVVRSDLEAKSVDFGVAKKPEGGLLGKTLRALKPNRILSLPLKLLKAINPFAPTDPEKGATSFAGSIPVSASGAAQNEPVQEKARWGDLNPRAWTTTVGWHPGASAFYDPITFEW